MLATIQKPAINRFQGSEPAFAAPHMYAIDDSNRCSFDCDGFCDPWRRFLQLGKDAHGFLQSFAC